MLIPVVFCRATQAPGCGLFSRASRQKQFIAPPDGEALLQKTFVRKAVLAGVTGLLTVTSRAYYFQPCNQYVKAGASPDHFNLLEPVRRSTAPAVAMATLFSLERFGQEAVLLVMAADHLVTLQNRVGAAKEPAAAALLGYLRVPAASAEIGCGHIERDSANPVHSGYRIKQFGEKPSVEEASVR